jgi:hypothetical protein
MPSGRRKKAERLEFNGTHQFVVCIDDVNLLD